MNVDEYFPEGLSVIHPDESQREKQRGLKEELLTTFSPPIHCHVCYKNILGTVNNVDYFKPCNCPIMYVHTKCAFRYKMKFRHAKCSNCGGENTLQRRPDRPSGCAFSPEISLADQACSVCHNTDYDEKKEDARKTLRKKIKPCFCGRVFHFGCFKSFLEEKSSCTDCGVIYHSFEPASLFQFLKSNWIYYVSCVLVLAFLSTLFTIALKNSILTKSGYYDTKSLILTGTAAFFFFVIAAFVICVLKYTWCSAIPRFQVKHGKFILKPYKKSSTSRLMKKVLDPVQEDEFEEIPLTELKKQPGEDNYTAESHPIEDARSYDNDDMTLGQHMFGIYATHHSSSTPIDRPTFGFAFDSV